MKVWILLEESRCYYACERSILGVFDTEAGADKQCAYLKKKHCNLYYEVEDWDVEEGG